MADEDIPTFCLGYFADLIMEQNKDKPTYSSSGDSLISSIIEPNPQATVSKLMKKGKTQPRNDKPRPISPVFSLSGDSIVSAVPHPEPTLKLKRPRPISPDFSSSGDSILSSIPDPPAPQPICPPPKPKKQKKTSKGQPRFKTVTNEGRDKLLSNVDSKNTLLATENGVKIFKGLLNQVDGTENRQAPKTIRCV